MLTRGEHRCEHCGAQRIRRARAHTPWQKLVRATALLERYACGECGHRGWRVPSTLPRVHRPAVDPGLAPRPIEERDRRMDRRARRAVVRSVVLAALLGVGAATLFVLGK